MFLSEGLKMPTSKDSKLSDCTATLSVLKTQIMRFAENRDWLRFHKPKNLVMSIAIEAAELMEHYQWFDDPAADTSSGSKTMASIDRMEQVEDEMADVLSYLLQLANVLDVDLASAFERKMVKNAMKYPSHD
jgi:dCTP diphosphatase